MTFIPFTADFSAYFADFHVVINGIRYTLIWKWYMVLESFDLLDDYKKEIGLIEKCRKMCFFCREKLVFTVQRKLSELWTKHDLEPFWTIFLIHFSPKWASLLHFCDQNVFLENNLLYKKFFVGFYSSQCNENWVLYTKHDLGPFWAIFEPYLFSKMCHLSIFVARIFSERCLTI